MVHFLTKLLKIVKIPQILPILTQISSSRAKLTLYNTYFLLLISNMIFTSSLKNCFALNFIKIS